MAAEFIPAGVLFRSHSRPSLPFALFCAKSSVTCFAFMVLARQELTPPDSENFRRCGRGLTV